jgi:hypothetical protein
VSQGEYSLPPGVQISSICGNLLQCLILANPEKRMSFQSLFEHPFIRNDPTQYRQILKDWAQKKDEMTQSQP